MAAVDILSTFFFLAKMMPQDPLMVTLWTPSQITSVQRTTYLQSGVKRQPNG